MILYPCYTSYHQAIIIINKHRSVLSTVQYDMHSILYANIQHTRI